MGIKLIRKQRFVPSPFTLAVYPKIPMFPIASSEVPHESHLTQVKNQTVSLREVTCPCIYRLLIFLAALHDDQHIPIFLTLHQKYQPISINTNIMQHSGHSILFVLH